MTATARDHTGLKDCTGNLRRAGEAGRSFQDHLRNTCGSSMQVYTGCKDDAHTPLQYNYTWRTSNQESHLQTTKNILSLWPQQRTTSYTKHNRPLNDGLD